MNTLYIIEEIVNKECERYELEEGGFIYDRKELIHLITKCPHTLLSQSDNSPEDFSGYKSRLLTYLYTQKNYAAYFHRSRSKLFMRKLIRRLMKNAISFLRQKNTEITIDQEMRLPLQHTLAFKLSTAFFAQLYPELFASPRLFATPEQIELYCEASVKELYPLNYPRLIKCLKQRDDEFWTEIIFLIRRFCFYLLRRKQPTCVREEIKKEIEMESILSVQEQIKKDKLENLESGTHLFHSLRTTCRNKMLEYYHRHIQQKETMLDCENWDLIAQESEDTSFMDTQRMEFENKFLYLLDLNTENDYDLSCAVVDVLCYGKGKIYQQLVKDDKDKVDILMMHSYEGKEYTEIATILHGNSETSTCAALRQTVTRIKRQLKKRMKKIVQQLKQG